MMDFLKMHGLGNDFIIFDWRDGGPATVSEAAARALGKRGRGDPDPMWFAMRGFDAFLLAVGGPMR